MGGTSDRPPASGDVPPASIEVGRGLRRLFRAPVRLYDWHLGWTLGHRFLRLTHQGRRSGRRYRTVLEVIGRDRSSGEYLVIAGFGRRADWFRNVSAARQPVEIEVARDHFPADHRILGEDEAMAVLASYEHRNRLLAPVVRRMLGRMIGQPYDGSESARQAAVQRLPVVGFRPRVPA